MSIQKRRGGFTARWYGPDKVERSKHFRTRREAEDYLATQRVKVNTGAWVAPEQGRVSLQGWADETWLPTLSHLKPSTRTRYATLSRVHVLTRFGRVPLDKVTHAEVAGWVSDLSASGLAPSTVRAAHRVLSLMLGLAVEDGRLSRNVAQKVKLPRARRSEPRFLTRSELERLASAMGAEGDVVRFLGLTGLRYGECAALRVGSVDFLRRRLRVVEAVAEVAGRLEYGEPKTHAKRSVPLAPSLLEAMALRCKDKGPRDLVFTAPRGGELRQRAFRVRFDRAVREAGLEDVSPHDLRHTAASLAVSAGANVKAVQKMLGHKSAAMTLDVYAGLFDDDLDGLAERMDGQPAPSNADFLRTGGEVTPLPDRSAGR